MSKVRAGSTIPAGVIGALVIDTWPVTRTTSLVTVTGTTWPELSIRTGCGGIDTAPQAYEGSTRPPVGAVSVTVQVVPTGRSVRRPGAADTDREGVVVAVVAGDPDRELGVGGDAVDGAGDRLGDAHPAEDRQPSGW